MVLQVAALAVFVALGGVLPRVDQGLVTRDTVVNLLTGALLVLVRLGVVALLGPRAGTGLLDLGWLPGVAQLLVAFVVLDLGRYAVHRLDHAVPWLWTFHRVHHTTERLDATAGLRMHVVDLLQLTAIPAVLYGLLLDGTSLAGWVLPAALGIGAVSDAFQHANLRWPTDHPAARAWTLVLNNPHFHAWHHARGGEHGNYGNVLTVWDRVLGTAVGTEDAPDVFGLEAAQDLRPSVHGLQLLRSRPAEGERST